MNERPKLTTSPLTAKPKPQVSIGMPVHNGARFIREAIDSLLAQTFSDFELIISDNASIDITEAICREYAAMDQRIRYVRQPENLGATANFIFVLDKAVGRYFMWAAADDIWDINWLESLSEMVYKKKCVAYGEMRNIRQNGINAIYEKTISYNFSGSKLKRRLAFIFHHFKGKANPIYGLFPNVEILKKNARVLDSDCPGSDMRLIYAILGDVEILDVRGTKIYKRLNQHEEILIDEVRNKSVKSQFLKLVLGYRLLVDVMSEIFRGYMPLSSSSERVVIIILSPFILVHFCLSALLRRSKF